MGGLSTDYITAEIKQLSIMISFLSFLTIEKGETVMGRVCLPKCMNVM